jgi:hypothetical protein
LPTATAAALSATIIITALAITTTITITIIVPTIATTVIEHTITVTITIPISTALGITSPRHLYGAGLVIMRHRRGVDVAATSTRGRGGRGRRRRRGRRGGKVVGDARVWTLVRQVIRRVAIETAERLSLGAFVEERLILRLELLETLDDGRDV